MSRNSNRRNTLIKLVLNDSVALDALILNRLATLPASRKNGWLQSLLVRGFCEECAEIQALQQGSDDGPRYIPQQNSMPPPASQESAAAPLMAAPSDTVPEGPATQQPLTMASLKAVVG